MSNLGTKNTRKFAFAGTEFNIAFNGCHKCDQVGKKIGKRTAFWSHSGVLRTDESFRLRDDLEHHNIMENSSIESLNIKIISLLVLDPMHLIDIGVMKKMLINNLKGVTNGFNKRLLELVPYVTSESGRKPRMMQGGGLMQLS